MFSVKQLTEVTLDKDTLHGIIARNMKSRDDYYSIDVRYPNIKCPNHAFVSFQFENEANTIAVYNALVKTIRKVITLDDVMPIVENSQELTEDDLSWFRIYSNRERDLLKEIREMLNAPPPYNNNNMYNVTMSEEGCVVVLTIECDKLIMF